jgi:probable HAF family extracellular repeat protein
MLNRSHLLLTCSLLSLAVMQAARADTPTLTSLGSLGGSSGSYLSEAGYWGGEVVTDTGIVVGDAIASNGTNVAFLWAPSGGMTNIDTTGQGASSSSYAIGVSADGSVVVGQANFGNAGGNFNAFRWTQATGMVDIDTTGQGASSFSYAIGVSADGSVVVGSANFGNGFSNQNAFRWTQATGMVDIDTTGQGASSNSYANGVSADGSVVVGQAIFGNAGSNQNAFRWTQATGMVDIDTTGLGASSYSYAFDVSSDGSVVVGQAIFGNAGSNANAYRWTQATGMVDIDTTGLGASSNSYSNGVSADGRVVVGAAVFGNDGGNSNAFRWTQTTGMQNINTLLSTAGVNMSGITLQYAYGVSPNGTYITGYGTFANNTLGEAFLVYYNDAIAGVTTAPAQQEATQQLAVHQMATAIESRSTANEVLGMTRPMDTGHYVQSGGMFGSEVGYASGQYSAHGVTVLGGIAYGAQDYPDLHQNAAVTPAVAVRYTFDDPFGDEGDALHPYTELGGWATPDETLTFTRPYANGAGTSYGSGSTHAAAWAAYGRGGMMADVDADNRLTGYGELGVQYLSYGGYGEALTAQNPFPATVNGGLMHMDIARAGGEWTSKLGSIESDQGQIIPVSVTLAGAAAHSFGVHAPVATTVAGIGVSTGEGEDATWGEYGARLEAQFTDNIALDLDITGTTGGNGIGTTVHGGGGISYKF